MRRLTDTELVTASIAVPVSTARDLGKRHGADKIVIIALRENGEFCITTYGRTKALCGALRDWSDTRGDRVALEILVP